MKTIFQAVRHQCLVPALLTLSMLLHAQLASAQSTLDLNPYSQDVKKAIEGDPAAAPPRTPLDLNRDETPACREMRIRLERAHDAPPPSRADAYAYSDGRRRDVWVDPARRNITPLPPGYSPLQMLELRYRQECVK